MTTPPPKSDRRILRSKQALRTALLQLMERKDFASISITEIVELADYNRGTFYSHYDGKQALLDDIVADLTQDLLRSFRAPYENADVFRLDELPAHAILIFEHFYQHKSVYHTLMKSDVLRTVREQMLTALMQISREDLDSAKPSGINPELLAVYSFSALIGLIFHWIETGFPYTPAYMQEQLVKLILHRPATELTVHKKTASPRKGKGGTSTRA